jgi:DNA-binding SARP family transcriptional activator
MWFGILGPVLVRHGDVVVDVPAARHRTLLVALLLHAGTTVSADTLAEMVWDGAPPPGAVVTLRSHVSRLRQVLGPDVGDRVVTRYRGYLIEAAEEEVDLLRFRRLCREGAAAARNREWARAWELLEEALGLWRGAPLADVPGELLRRDELPGLEELRLQALEWRIDAGLGLGRHDELAAELQPLTGAHPLRERFYTQLMLAQYRCGRQAEALATYQSARQVLAEALGTDPGTELRDLHQRILTADVSLDFPRPPEPASLLGDKQPVLSDRSAESPRREPIGRTWESAKPPRSLGLRATRGAVAAAALGAAAITALLTSSVSGSAHAPRPAAQAASPFAQGASLAPGPTLNWQCGPLRRAKIHHGSLIDQRLQACIASDHGHVDLEGLLLGSDDAWKEQIILVLRHPGQPAYKKLVSPVCAASTCIYKVMVDPGSGSWQVMPQWSSDGGYQSTGKSSPSITYPPPVPRPSRVAASRFAPASP